MSRPIDLAVSLCLIAFGGILVSVAWRDDASRAWRRFVMVLAVAVIVVPAAVLLWSYQ